MESNPDTVWWPIGADSTLCLFLSCCEKRAESKTDPFEFDDDEFSVWVEREDIQSVSCILKICVLGRDDQQFFT